MYIREQTIGVISLLPPCGSGRSNSDHQAWWQTLSPLSQLASPTPIFFPNLAIIWRLLHISLQRDFLTHFVLSNMLCWCTTVLLSNLWRVLGSFPRNSNILENCTYTIQLWLEAHIHNIKSQNSPCRKFEASLDYMRFKLITIIIVTTLGPKA